MLLRREEGKEGRRREGGPGRRKKSEVLSILSKRLNSYLKGPHGRFAKLAAVINLFVSTPFAS